MESREIILNAILKNKPASKDLPEIPSFSLGSESLVTTYQRSLESNGGRSFLIKDLAEIKNYLENTFVDGLKIISMLPSVTGTVDIKTITDPHLLEDLEVAVIKGRWGASENAAIWFEEEDFSHRALPFIAQHLVVLLEEKSILKDLHELYKRIKINETSYGVLIAGPSKTADIEQSLVIGAHGPRSMTVFII